MPKAKKKIALLLVTLVLLPLGAGHSGCQVIEFVCLVVRVVCPMPQQTTQAHDMEVYVDGQLQRAQDESTTKETICGLAKVFCGIQAGVNSTIEVLATGSKPLGSASYKGKLKHGQNIKLRLKPVGEGLGTQPIDVTIEVVKTPPALK